ncbi:MAG: hypothetical protein LBL69_03830 [Zoogloeaceae bacterium]|jgi:hypothetical protein|nr:hypothetical protein [Zoogloeaceae bacterium]
MAATIKRERRSSIERRCLSKGVKRAFRGQGTAVMRMMYLAECTARKRRALGSAQQDKSEKSA